MYICICAAVTDHEIREKIAEGAHSLDELSMELGVGLGCGTCVHAAEKLLFETRARLISLESVKINLRDVCAAANMDASAESATARAATTAENWPCLETA